SNTPSHRRNQLSRAKMNLAQGGRPWRFAPGKISMLRMEHTLGVVPRGSGDAGRYSRSFGWAASVASPPFEEGKPTGARSDPPKPEHQSVKVVLTLLLQNKPALLLEFGLAYSSGSSSRRALRKVGGRGRCMCQRTNTPNMELRPTFRPTPTH